VLTESLSPPKRILAIAIGGSAGGLAALTILLETLPPTYPIPLLIVQHRGKDTDHLLENVLQEKCLIPIKQADEKEEIKAPGVYIAPPDYHLLIEKNKTCSLSADDYINYSRPSIDVLFETASIAYGDTLVGILLTGTNSDGAKGMQAILNKGGITIAQDPKEALYPSMPEAAIKLGAARHVWSLAQIKDYLKKITV
jgi:two-component system chemotaxis response regulator CheB